MKITYSAKGMDVHRSVKELARARLEKHLSTFLDEVEVVFKKEGDTVHLELHVKSKHEDSMVFSTEVSGQNHIRAIDEVVRAVLAWADPDAATRQGSAAPSGLDVIFAPDVTPYQMKVALRVLGDLFQAAGGQKGLKIDATGSLPTEARVPAGEPSPETMNG